jgi:hypothetical protein
LAAGLPLFEGLDLVWMALGGDASASGGEHSRRKRSFAVEKNRR